MFRAENAHFLIASVIFVQAYTYSLNCRKIFTLKPRK